MKTIPAGQFKTHCLSLLDQVAITREPLIVTKRGNPVAQLLPVSQEASEAHNPLKNSIVFEKDLLSPIEVQWENE